MTTTIAVAALVALLALSFWRPLRRVRSALGLAHLAATGHVFLVLGWGLGMALGVRRDQPLTHAIGPLVTLAVGWVGFSCGTRFEARVLRAVPRRAFARALAPAVLSALAVGGVGAAVLLLSGVPVRETLAAALCLAAAAASSGPTLAAILRTRRPGRVAQTRSLLRMAEFSAGIGDGVVVVLAVVAFSFFPPDPHAASPAVLGAIAFGGAAALGLATWLFLGGRASDDERLLLGLAALALIAGLGGWIQVAPAAVAAVAAIVLANLPGSRAGVLVTAVHRVERPAVVIAMAAIGLHVAGPLTWHVAPLAAAMVLVRLYAKALGARGADGPIEAAPGLSTSRGWYGGLVPQGILGLVVALSLFQVWQTPLARSVLAAAAIGGLINELLAPVLLVRVLGRAAPRGASEAGARSEASGPLRAGDAPVTRDPEVER